MPNEEAVSYIDFNFYRSTGISRAAAKEIEQVISRFCDGLFEIIHRKPLGRGQAGILAREIGGDIGVSFMVELPGSSTYTSTSALPSLNSKPEKEDAIKIKASLYKIVMGWDIDKPLGQIMDEAKDEVRLRILYNLDLFT